MTQIALAFAALFAVLLARRVASRRQRRIAGALCLLLALDVIRSASLRFRAVPPYEGAARASWAVSGAALFAWYAAVAWAVWGVLKQESPAPLGPEALNRSRWRQPRGILLALAFPASSVFLFAAYPLIRGAPYMAVARAAFALAISAQTIAVLRFALRGQHPDSPQVVALLLALSSLASAAGPWAFGEPLRDWALARMISVVTWIVVGGVETWMLLRRRIGS